VCVAVNLPTFSAVCQCGSPGASFYRHQDWLYEIRRTVAVLLTACEKTIRECDGIQHPLAEVWTGDGGLGEVIFFRNNEGNCKILFGLNLD